MNREPNKEIDILLRKLSGKQNGNITAAEGNSSASSHEHLDADELNAYAENALPAALRSRYTEHLADCSSCRSLVTQLSLSSTSALAQPRVEESTPSRLKTFLAALFSPLVIRYAVPAMAVILVVALAWIVVRRQPINEHVAQNTGSQSPVPDSQLNRSGAAAVPNESGSPAAQINEPRSTASSAEPKSAPARSAVTATEEKAAETGAGDKAPEDRKSDKRKQGEDAAKNVSGAAPPPVIAKAPSAGAADTAQPKTVKDVPQNEPEAKKKAESEIAKSQTQVQQESNNRRANEQQRSGPSEPKAVQRGMIAGQRNEAVREQSRQRAKEAEEDKDTTRDDDAEVRTVAGHKFTRRGAVWVDALYRSGDATTNVSRDSEQYRSLIGDEPGLRAIAERLSGEFIVVWKGRPYRIK
jgi:putative zinc finger protein